MRRLLSISAMETKLFLRASQAAFWTFVFPGFLLVLLGSVYGQRPGQIAFLVPGVFGMVVASTAYYGVGVAIAQYRSSGFLKRLALIPIPTWQYLLGHVLARCAIVLAVGVELLAISAGLFRVGLTADPLTLAVVLIIGIPAFVASGMAMGMLARSLESANSIASVLFFSMTFLGGAYYPVSLLPHALQPVAAILPLSYFLEGLRAAADGLAPAAVSTDLVVLVGWGALGLVAATRWFKWTT